MILVSLLVYYYLLNMNRNDILYAKRVLRGMHPLYNLEIELCLPFCDPCFGLAKRCFGMD